jgi:hypothetical protein
MFKFKFDNSRVAMPRIHFGSRRKREQLSADRLQQRFVIAARKVSTANTAVKKHIATNDKILLPAIKNKASGRMPLTKQYLQLCMAELHQIAFF